MRTKLSARTTRILAIFLALILTVSLTACGGNTRDEDLSSSATTSRGPGFTNSLDPNRSNASNPGIDREFLPSFVEIISEKKAINSDTVGYLQVPDTVVDDVVLWYPNDANEYYLRRNFDKQYQKEGCYYADFRCTFDGGVDGLSRNTVIYGHSLDMEDDPNAPYFSQLKKYLDEDFARENPYIYFSIEGEDLVWEIFSVYYATINLNYNTPDLTNDEFQTLVDEMIKRSEYIYKDVSVSADDKILTLSTCTYVFTPGVYPNNYRYVISARLVGDDEAIKEEADLEKNPNPKDP